LVLSVFVLNAAVDNVCDATTNSIKALDSATVHDMLQHYAFSS